MGHAKQIQQHCTMMNKYDIVNTSRSSPKAAASAPAGPLLLLLLLFALVLTEMSRLLTAAPAAHAAVISGLSTRTFFTISYDSTASGTSLEDKCGTLCRAASRLSYPAWIMNASENTAAIAAMSLVASSGVIVLGGRRVLVDNSWWWLEAPVTAMYGSSGLQFYQPGVLLVSPACVSGRYCNWGSSEPTDVLGSKPQLVYKQYSGVWAWGSVADSTAATGCLCRNYGQFTKTPSVSQKSITQAVSFSASVGSPSRSVSQAASISFSLGTQASTMTPSPVTLSRSSTQESSLTLSTSPVATQSASRASATFAATFTQSAATQSRCSSSSSSSRSTSTTLSVSFTASCSASGQLRTPTATASAPSSSTNTHSNSPSSSSLSVSSFASITPSQTPQLTRVSRTSSATYVISHSHTATNQRATSTASTRSVSLANELSAPTPTVSPTSSETTASLKPERAAVSADALRTPSRTASSATRSDSLRPHSGSVTLSSTTTVSGSGSKTRQRARSRSSATFTKTCSRSERTYRRHSPSVVQHSNSQSMVSPSTMSQSSTMRTSLFASSISQVSRSLLRSPTKAASSSLSSSSSSLSLSSSTSASRIFGGALSTLPTRSSTKRTSRHQSPSVVQHSNSRSTMSPSTTAGLSATTGLSATVSLSTTLRPSLFAPSTTQVTRSVLQSPSEASFSSASLALSSTSASRIFRDASSTLPTRSSSDNNDRYLQASTTLRTTSRTLSISMAMRSRLTCSLSYTKSSSRSPRSSVSLSARSVTATKMVTASSPTHTKRSITIRHPSVECRVASGGLLDPPSTTHNSTMIVAASGCSQRDTFPIAIGCPLQSNTDIPFGPIRVEGSGFPALSFTNASATDEWVLYFTAAPAAVGSAVTLDTVVATCGNVSVLSSELLLCYRYNVSSKSDVRDIIRTYVVLCQQGKNFTSSSSTPIIVNASFVVVAASLFPLLWFSPLPPASTSVACPTSVPLVACSGHGSCDALTRTCMCDNSNALGYWVGASCSLCDVRYNDSDGCALPCPASGGVVCSGRGVCANGQCLCDGSSLWSSSACNDDCPGDDGVCSGHGTCALDTAQCTCTTYDNGSSGGYDGAACNVCVTGFSGAACTTPCPIGSNGNVCSGHDHGACYEGACFCVSGYCGRDCGQVDGVNDCGACPSPTQYGAHCELTCPPGSSTALPCAGHGTCSTGQYGTGVCRCTYGYGSSDCSVACPSTRVAGNSSTSEVYAMCSGNGACAPLTGRCACFRYFSGAACNIRCPVSPANDLICSGHGVCDEGSSGTGACICSSGYRGPLCSSTCVSLDGSSTTCSGHGTCTAAGACQCSSDAVGGFWTGDNCAVCATPYAGPQCTGTCPSSSPLVVCSGHGVCNATVGSSTTRQVQLFCHCAANGVAGYWSGESCGNCQRGYYGVDCLLECPGGGCSPCSSHGVCDDGVNGTGVCTCNGTSSNSISNSSANVFISNWTSQDCSLCAAGRYGANCDLTCPILAGTTSSSATVCGHGTCNDGHSGDGTCVCNAGYALNTTGLCTLCAPGYFGPACRRCPIGNSTLSTAQAQLVCSGAGECDDGIDGTGACLCVAGHAGVSCNVSCGVAFGITCGHDGTCNPNGTCTCRAGSLWTLSAANNGTCSVCIAGRYGANCSMTCPPCVHGQCNPIDGTCTCTRGAYWGALCDTVCPGGPLSPCSGHGTCEQATGRCNCRSSIFEGFFSGEVCEKCDSSYLSTSCNVPCPKFNGLVCYGRGTCFNGVCSNCEPLANETKLIILRCGVACDSIDNACINASSSCPAAYYGPTCSNVCPATIAAAIGNTTTATLSPCSGRGLCDALGVCHCGSGFYGSGCESQCPTVIAEVSCSGHGSCQQTGQCSCDQGAYGASCSLPCPGGFSNACYGHGVCDPVDGACSCTGGYAGAACLDECPGGHLTPCMYHGTCNTVAVHCECNSNAIDGFFTGATCNTCAPYYTGIDCNVYCPLYRGVIVGSVCVCVEGYTGEDCALICPTGSSSSSSSALLQTCGGHGVCSVSLKSAVCACAADYYGPACDTYCTIASCLASTPFLRPQCNSATGVCECRDTATLGRWTGGTCSDCSAPSWGAECTLVCLCNEHGTCDRTSGACNCYDDNTNGHWSNDDCSKCASGYTGSLCTVIDISLAPAGADVATSRPLGSVTFVAAQPIASVLDATLGVLIVQDMDVRRRLNIVRAAPSGVLTILGVLNVSSDASAVPIRGDILNETHYYWLTESVVLMGGVADETVVFGTVLLARSVVASFLPSMTTTAAATSRRQRRQSAPLGTNAVSSSSSSPVAPQFEFTTDSSPLPNATTVAGVHTVCRVYAAMNTTTSNFTATVACGDSSAGSPTAATVANVSKVFTEVPWIGLMEPPTTSPSGMLQNPVLVMVGPSTSDVGNWAMVGWDTVTATTTVVRINTDTTARGIIQRCACNGATGNIVCTIVDAFVSASTTRTVRLLQFPLVPSTTTGVDNNTSTVQQITMSTMSSPLNTLNVTCLTLAQPSDVLDVGAVSFHETVSLGSQLFLFEVSSMTLLGTVTVIPGSVVAVLRIDTALRLMYTVRESNAATIYSVLNVFGVRRVWPNVIDAEGGATVTVTGAGFPVPAVTDSSINESSILLPVWCNVSSLLVPAVVLNRTTLMCVAPAKPQELSLSTGGGICSVDPLTIVIGGSYQNRSTQRSVAVGLLRPVSADVDDAGTLSSSVNGLILLNRYGPYDAPFLVALHGFGFVASSAAACRLTTFVADVVVFTSTNVTVINSTMVVCSMPSGLPVSPTDAQSRTAISYSHDGTYFGPSRAAFQIVGPVDGISADVPQVLVASAVSPLPTITVHTTDIVGNERRRLAATDASYAIQCSSLLPAVKLAGNAETVAFVNPQNLASATNTVTGIATVAGVLLSKPVAGILPLYCYALINLAWNTTVLVTVLAGEGSALSVVPSLSWLAGVVAPRRLQPPAILHVTDSAGNSVPGTSTEASVVFSAYSTSQTGSSAVTSLASPGSGTDDASAFSTMSSTTTNVVRGTSSSVAGLGLDGTYSFDSIVMRTAFDVPASMTFTLANMDALTMTVPQESCMPGVEYAVPGTFTCSPCPTNGVCDGTSFIVVPAGYWRASAGTYELYVCPGGVDACSGSAVSGDCRPGYHGLRCATCDDGYGRSGPTALSSTCDRCPSAAVSWAVICVIFTAFVTLVVYLAIASMPILCSGEIELFALAARGVAATAQNNPFAIVLKIVITHVQILSMLPIQSLELPEWFQNFISGSGRIRMSPSLSFVACELASDDVQLLKVSLYLLPLAVVLLALAAVTVAWRRLNADLVQEKAELARRVAAHGNATLRPERQNLARLLAGRDQIYFSSIVMNHDDQFRTSARPRGESAAFDNDHDDEFDGEDNNIGAAKTADQGEGGEDAPSPLLRMRQLPPKRSAAAPPLSGFLVAARTAKSDIGNNNDDMTFGMLIEPAVSSAFVTSNEARDTPEASASLETGNSATMRWPGAPSPGIAALNNLINSTNNNANATGGQEDLCSEVSTPPPLSATLLHPTAVTFEALAASMQQHLPPTPPPSSSPHSRRPTPPLNVIPADPSPGLSSHLASPPPATFQLPLLNHQTPPSPHSPQLAVGGERRLSNSRDRKMSLSTSLTRSATNAASTDAAAAAGLQRRMSQLLTESFNGGGLPKFLAAEERGDSAEAGDGSKSAAEESLKTLHRRVSLLLMDDSPSSPTEKIDRMAKMIIDNAAAQASQESLDASKNVNDFVARSVNVWFVSVVVMFFILYPVLISGSASLLKCETVSFGPNQPDQHVLVSDPSISCDDTTFASRVTALGWSVLIVIGVGVPIFSVSVVKCLQFATCDGDNGIAKLLLFFVTGGYRDRVWYWESVSLFRKFILVVCVNGTAVVQNDQHRMLLGTWVLLVSFFINVVAQPWEEHMLYLLEAASLAVCAATYGLCVMMFLPSPAVSTAQPSSSLHLASSALSNSQSVVTLVVIALLNVAMLMFIVYVGFWSIRSIMAQYVRRRGLIGSACRWILAALDSTEQRVQSADRQVRSNKRLIYRAHARSSTTYDLETLAAMAIADAEEAITLAAAEKELTTTNHRTTTLVSVLMQQQQRSRRRKSIAASIASVDDDGSGGTPKPHVMLTTSPRNAAALPLPFASPFSLESATSAAAFGSHRSFLRRRTSFAQGVLSSKKRTSTDSVEAARSQSQHDLLSKVKSKRSMRSANTTMTSVRSAARSEGDEESVFSVGRRRQRRLSSEVEGVGDPNHQLTFLEAAAGGDGIVRPTPIQPAIMSVTSFEAPSDGKMSAEFEEILEPREQQEYIRGDQIFERPAPSLRVVDFGGSAVGSTSGSQQIGRRQRAMIGQPGQAMLSPHSNSSGVFLVTPRGSNSNSNSQFPPSHITSGSYVSPLGGRTQRDFIATSHSTSDEGIAGADPSREGTPFESSGAIRAPLGRSRQVFPHQRQSGPSSHTPSAPSATAVSRGPTVNWFLQRGGGGGGDAFGSEEGDEDQHSLSVTATPSMRAQHQHMHNINSTVPSDGRTVVDQGPADGRPFQKGPLRVPVSSLPGGDDSTPPLPSLSHYAFLAGSLDNAPSLSVPVTPSAILIPTIFRSGHGALMRGGTRRTSSETPVADTGDDDSPKLPQVLPESKSANEFDDGSPLASPKYLRSALHLAHNSNHSSLMTPSGSITAFDSRSGGFGRSRGAVTISPSGVSLGKLGGASPRWVIPAAHSTHQPGSSTSTSDDIANPSSFMSVKRDSTRGALFLAAEEAARELLAESEHLPPMPMPARSPRGTDFISDNASLPGQLSSDTDDTMMATLVSRNGSTTSTPRSARNVKDAVLFGAHQAVPATRSSVSARHNEGSFVVPSSRSPSQQQHLLPGHRTPTGSYHHQQRPSAAGSRRSSLQRHISSGGQAFGTTERSSFYEEAVEEENDEDAFEAQDGGGGEDFLREVPHAQQPRPESAVPSDRAAPLTVHAAVARLVGKTLTFNNLHSNHIGDDAFMSDDASYGSPRRRQPSSHRTSSQRPRSTDGSFQRPTTFMPYHNNDRNDASPIGNISNHSHGSSSVDAEGETRRRAASASSSRSGFFRRAISAGGISPPHVSLMTSARTTRQNSRATSPAPSAENLLSHMAPRGGTLTSPNNGGMIPFSDGTAKLPAAAALLLSSRLKAAPHEVVKRRSHPIPHVGGGAAASTVGDSSAASPSLFGPAAATVSAAGKFLTKRRKSSAFCKKHGRRASSFMASRVTERQLRDACGDVHAALSRFQLLQTFTVVHLDCFDSRTRTQQGHSQQREGEKRAEVVKSRYHADAEGEGKGTAVVSISTDESQQPKERRRTSSITQYDDDVLCDLFHAELDLATGLQHLEHLLAKDERQRMRREGSFDSCRNGGDRNSIDDDDRVGGRLGSRDESSFALDTVDNNSDRGESRASFA